jgi:hypothetical protein
MDFKKLIPDFSAIGKTNWGKPNLDTKNPMWLVMAGAALLMVVFVFLPWQSVSMNFIITTVSDSVIGLNTWFGLFAFLFALVSVYGVLYNQKQFAFCGALLAAVFALIGCFSVPEFSYTIGGWTETLTPNELKVEIDEGRATLSHLGAILFLVASLVLAGASFLQIKKENE